jgi:hypothetical protein
MPEPRFAAQQAMMDKWPIAAEKQEPVAKKPAPPPEKQIVIKRRDQSTDEQLRKELLRVKEISLDQPNSVPRSSTITQLANRSPLDAHFTPRVLAYYPDLQGLPFRMGNDCQLGKEPAENMQAMSRKMRSIVAESMGKNGAGDNRINADYMAQKISEEANIKDFSRSGAVPCLMQMLQPENTPVRQLMVQQLANIPHRSASEGLAKLAVFDLSDEVRREALQALDKRPREEYRQVLLVGLRHVWPAAADHAAEALVALNDKKAVPLLEELAAQPDPATPFFDKHINAWMVPEMTRINHLRNCLMCHAPSNSTSDMVRGRIPTLNQPLPPLTQYYEDQRGPFVRADVTYLRQDFSLYQPVEKPGPWPLMQRFDYTVRARRVDTQAELNSLQKRADASYPQREAVMFAFEELSR